jgi:hypothetical protein
LRIKECRAIVAVRVSLAKNETAGPEAGRP